jgi:hypothetical protein
MPMLNTKDRVVDPGSTLNSGATSKLIGCSTADPANATTAGVVIGATTGTNIIDGSLYVTKIDCGGTLITGVGRAFTGAFTAATLLALPVYRSDGTTATRLGTVDLVALGSTGQGAPAPHPANYTLPNPGTVYVGFVYSGATAGGIRVPAGGLGANYWQNTGDEYRWAVAATGITTLAAIPASFTIASLNAANMPNGPLVCCLQGQ